MYAIRLAFAILSMEVVLHFLYVVAISKTSSRGSWANDTPAQLAMISYFNLHIIWLKLLIPWRFFRLWALIDGIDPPENMLRCMSNNVSALAFWRAWHRSFNRWIVRYIYIPLGGGQRPLINMVAVFTFVALWHDLSLKLLAWGWLVVLFVVPEIVARKVFTPKRFEGRETLYRHLSSIGGVGNMLMMMSANLVGFAIGLDGLKEMVHGKPRTRHRYLGPANKTNRHFHQRPRDDFHHAGYILALCGGAGNAGAESRRAEARGESEVLMTFVFF